MCVHLCVFLDVIPPSEILSLLIGTHAYACVLPCGMCDYKVPMNF